MHPSDGVYRNMIVRLADLAVTDDVITQVTFENCTLVGPAVIVLLGGTVMQGSSVDGDADSFLWPIGDRQYVMGAIAMNACAIVGCRLQRIGLAVADADLETVRAGFGLSP